LTNADTFLQVDSAYEDDDDSDSDSDGSSSSSTYGDGNDGNDIYFYEDDDDEVTYFCAEDAEEGESLQSFEPRHYIRRPASILLLASPASSPR
jgi:hypothetical protein